MAQVTIVSTHTPSGESNSIITFVIAAPQPGDWPNNEPAGMTELSHVNGLSLVWPGFNNPTNFTNNPTRVSVVADAASKFGSAIEKRFFVNDKSGWNTVINSRPRTLHREVYKRIVFKFSPNWDFHSGGNKLIMSNDAGRSGISMHNRGFLPYVDLNIKGKRLVGRSCRLIIPGSPTFTGGSNFSDGPFMTLQKNVYHTFEVWKRVNSAVGVADGAARIWWDGVEITRLAAHGAEPQWLDFSPTNREWITGSTGDPVSPANGITARTEAFLYWGGQGDTKTANDWIRLSEFYMSRRN